MNKMNQHKETGVAMVEFAIILPLLLLMLYGITEIGRAIYQQNSLYKGMMAGSRYLARAEEIIQFDPDGNSCTKIEPAYSAAELAAKNLIAMNVAEFPGFSTDDVVIDIPSEAVVVEGCKIIIQANSQFNALFIPLGGGDLGSFNIHAEIEERYIGR